MTGIYALLAIAAGIAVALQGVVNSRLRAHWDLWSTLLLNALVVVVICAVAWVATGAGIPDKDKLAATQPVFALGGVFGVVIIFAGAVVFGRLSASAALALILLGQFATAVIVDSAGLLGMPRVELTAARIGGLVCVAAGAYLLHR